MLKSFSCQNFKCFENPITIDFSDRKNAFIVGTGKTSLGLALFDIKTILGDGEIPDRYYYKCKNMNKLSKPMFFDYVFDFNGKIVKYSYSKSDRDTLITENLYIDDKEIISCDHLSIKYLKLDDELFDDVLSKVKNGRIDLKGESIISYLYRKSKDETIAQIIEFVDYMRYDNLVPYAEKMLEFLIVQLISMSLIDKFEEFLKGAGYEYDFVVKKKELFIQAEKDAIVRFIDIASTTEKTLLKIFHKVESNSEEISLLFLDDLNFSEKTFNFVTKYIEEKQIQSTITTNNENVKIGNRFVISDNKISKE